VSKIDLIKEHVNSVERVPSHYCQSNSSKQYLKLHQVCDVVTSQQPNNTAVNLKAVYTVSVPISKEKKQDLLLLCTLFQKRYVISIKNYMLYRVSRHLLKMTRCDSFPSPVLSSTPMHGSSECSQPVKRRRKTDVPCSGDWTTKFISPVMNLTPMQDNTGCSSHPKRSRKTIRTLVNLYQVFLHQC